MDECGKANHQTGSHRSSAESAIIQPQLLQYKVKLIEYDFFLLYYAVTYSLEQIVVPKSMVGKN